jgi:hypothetical protein
MTRLLSASTEKAAVAAPHAHAATAPRRFSLLRLSAGERIAGAAAVVALLWASVYWALH